ncbi:hypothetical protein, partial [Bacteroides uniformis]|uniref:hypothetical protein n=1 Tax=Bacteroides uniformis TaxID=820 RepID=UPI00321B153B
CPYTGSKSHTSGTIDNGVRPLITIFARRKRKISPKQTLTNVIYYKQKTEKNTWLNSCCQIVKAEYEKKK